MLASDFGTFGCKTKHFLLAKHIYKRDDKVYEVIDGQQRLLSIIGFLGREYLNENNKRDVSIKHKFRLKDLRILDKLNGCNVDTIDPIYINKILDFQLDVVEIDHELNQSFNSIDLFLRLNTKPYPIGEHTFEMWNSYVNKDVILALRNLTDTYAGNLFKISKEKDTRMNNRELITTLAYMDYLYLNGKSKNVLDVFLRSGKINARIQKKADITRVLNEVSTNADKFIVSVENTKLFIDKVRALTNTDYSLLNKIFDPKHSRNRSRTNQNFYLLWMMIKDLSIEKIIKNRDILFTKISDQFKLMQNYPKDTTLVNYNNILIEFL